MQVLRRILGDRLSGGVIAGLAGYFLLLQAFVAAFTCGMTVQVDAGPVFVVCHAAQTLESVSDNADEDEDGPSRAVAVECPCIICQGSNVDLTIALAPEADLGLAFALRDAVRYPLLDDVRSPVDPSHLGLAPEPRGPPTVSA